MKFIFLIFSILLISKFSFSNDIFQTKEYELKFTSENINSIKQKKINEIKIKSYYKLIKSLVNDKNLKKINYNDISFVNKFILNFQINDEKIINNNYYSKIKVHFNIDLIYDYLIKNNIKFVDKYQSKFLIIIIEQNELQNFQISSENKFYKFLINTSNKTFNEYFLIPKLDFNDRFILNNDNNYSNEFHKNELLNNKYKTEYQILVYSKKINNLFINEIYLYHENTKYFISKIPMRNLNYDKLFSLILSRSINKWKELNQIDTTLINKLECKIKINNIYELTYVRHLLKKNILIKDLVLKSIKLNNNLYNIHYYDNLNLLKKSLQIKRLNLIHENNTCFIELI